MDYASSSIAERGLAGLELLFRVLVWLTLFIPCAIWCLAALAADGGLGAAPTRAPP